MNNKLKEQKHIRLFSACSVLESLYKKDTFSPLEYAVLYKDFEEPIDISALAHLWLYPASDRTMPALNNHLKKALNKIAQLLPSQVIQPTSIQLKKDTNGKPYFAPPYEKMVVNFSYTNGFGLLGLSTKAAIGIDIVEVTESFKISGVVNSLFHPSEQLFFKTLDPVKAKNWFFNVWALKEAVLKSTGEGIAFGRLSKVLIELRNESYTIKDGLQNKETIAGSMTFKRNDIEFIIGVAVYDS